jgi:hypothetical protein
MNCPPQILAMLQALLHSQIALAITMIALNFYYYYFFTIFFIHSEQCYTDISGILENFWEHFAQDIWGNGWGLTVFSFY